MLQDLDHKAPADLRRLWSTRQKWLSMKGHGMWENIVRDSLGPEEADALTEDKKKQVKASLQMKIHRGVLRHGIWPACDVSIYLLYMYHSKILSVSLSRVQAANSLCSQTEKCTAQSVCEMGRKSLQRDL